MAKVVCVLYDDPVDGYPSPTRAMSPDTGALSRWTNAANPQRVDFQPGELLGSVSGELGLGKFLEDLGHNCVVTSDKDGPDSVFDKELHDAEIVISQPFWPAYLTAERIAKAPKLKLAITAGIGSDHVDLQAAIEQGVTVAEVTFCNSISVAEHVVMMILALVRNYIPSYQWVVKGGWNIADCVSSLLRPGRNDRRNGCRGTHRPGRVEAAEAVRCQAALYGPAPAPGTGREGTRSEVPSQCRVDGARLRRCHDQLSAPSRDRAPVQC